MKNILFGFSMLLFCLGACDTLEEEAFTIYTAENVYDNEKSAFSALVSCYDSYQGNYGNIIWGPGYGATDEIVMISWAQNRKSVISYDVYADGGDGGYWSGLYRTINRCNTFIDRMNEKDFGTPTSDGMIGEAKVIRAYSYFWLTRLFGDAPLILKGRTGLDDLLPSKNSSEEIYDQIIIDLNEAKEVLPLASEVEQHPRMSKGSAQGLLAEVYATMAGYPLNKKENWANVVTVCEEMFLENEHSLNPSYSNIFLNIRDDVYDTKYNEILLEIAYSIKMGEGGRIGATGIGDNSKDVNKGGGSWADLEYTDKLKSKYNTQDVRLEWNLSSKNHNAIKYRRRDYNDYHPFDNPINWIVQRFSDVVLLYAEALNEIHQGPTQVACDAINTMKLRARPDDKKDDNTINPLCTTSMSYEQFFSEIRDERARELCFEGYRWFDLKRWHILVETVQELAYGDHALPNLKAAKNISDKHYFYPIPQSEINVNPNLLPQNPGY
ncbi:MAG: RagB/SusD family nutrient uptake outer membrane protein [Marinilabiliaceae bacterium]|nr:RagB/SusD family nutrient uptake outer membrane protein [Marinilabiliaceae bacterium]